MPSPHRLHQIGIEQYLGQRSIQHRVGEGLGELPFGLRGALLQELVPLSDPRIGHHLRVRRVDLLEGAIGLGVIRDDQEIERLIEPDSLTVARDDLLSAGETVCLFRSQPVAGAKRIVGDCGVHMGVAEEDPLRIALRIGRIGLVFLLCNDAPRRSHECEKQSR